MPELVKIRPELFPKLYEAFLHDDDPYSHEQDWRNVFIYQWKKDEGHSGYALLEDSRVVGMMAMAFSNRTIAQRQHKFCNLHTWWVHEKYRGHSTAMLRPLLNLKDCTITHFTPCDRIRALTQRLGFETLNQKMKLLLPVRFVSKRNPGATRLFFNEQIDESKLNRVEQTIFRDHQPYRCGHLVVQDGEESCYVLYTHVVRYRVNYCHLHYIGNRPLYMRFEPEIRTALQKKHRVWFCALDSRLLSREKFANSFNFWSPAHAVFRPIDGITADQVDNLYSDVVMLRLASLPHVSFEIKKVIRRLLRLPPTE